MNLIKVVLPALALTLALAHSTRSAHAEAPSKHKPTFGVGYKVGNGVGFIGADIIVSPIAHLSFELQASWLSDFDSGYAVLPSVVASLWDQGSTPYIKAGALYLSATLDDATGTGTGGFANIGYEWKLQSGLGIQLGGGVSYIQDLTVVSGNQSASIGGKVNPNLELGLRYRF